MIIELSQEKWALGNKYLISVDDENSFYAESKLFRIFSEIGLFEYSISSPKFTIKRRWAWFNLAYDLIRSDKRVFKLKTVELRRGHYSCQVVHDSYDIYQNKGRRYSIFKNNIQIAYWEKDAISVYEGDYYRITADYDVDVELLICFCICIDNSYSNDTSKSSTTITYDFGNIWPTAKSFEETWKPKEKA